MLFLLYNYKLAWVNGKTLELYFSINKSINVNLNFLSLQNLAGNTVNTYFLKRIFFACSLQKNCKYIRAVSFHCSILELPTRGRNDINAKVCKTEKEWKKEKEQNQKKPRTGKIKRPYCLKIKSNKLWFNFLQRSLQDYYKF